MIQIGVVQFPGSNCERETSMAIERVGMRAVDLMWNAGPKDIERLDGYVIVGGFSYEDRGRSGLIASKAPLLDKLAQEVLKGKPILGICNGAQILVESGLVPGFPDRKLAMALTHNRRVKDNHNLGTGYYNAWCYMKPDKQSQTRVFDSYFTAPLHLPLAHAEGRFLISENLYQSLKEAGATLWYYCDKEGHIFDEFPINPNGSSHNLAAVSNFAGNVLAIMPHPERTLDGDIIFASMRNYIQSGLKFKPVYMNVDFPPISIEAYQCPEKHQEFVIGSSITDNEAVSMQKALAQMGYKLKLKRYVHWEVGNGNLAEDALRDSFVLYNPSKEYLAHIEPKVGTHHFLIREINDPFSEHTQEALQQHGISVKSVKRSVLWQIEGEHIEQAAGALIQKGFFFNPNAHHCYHYRREA